MAEGSEEGHSWLATVVDVVVVVVVLALGSLDQFAGRAQTPLLGLAVALPLLARRRWPFAVLAAVAAASAVTAVHQVGPWTPIGAIGVAGFTFGEFGRTRSRGAPVVLVVACLLAAALVVQATNQLEALVLPFVALLPAWLVGDIVRGRHEMVLTLAEAERRRVAAAEEQLRAAVLEQRRHMARELHDVVAHGVSVMLVQTGAARRVMATAPDRANEALVHAETAGREAMVELRQLLGVLSDDGDASGLGPQVGVDQLAPLLERIREAGLPAELAIVGDRRPLPTTLDITVYRIVQEALTNALRYAAGAKTVAFVTFEQAMLRVEVLDDGPGPAGRSDGTGRGLIGLEERMKRLGGRLEAGPRLGGGYAVRAWLPLDAAR